MPDAKRATIPYRRRGGPQEPKRPWLELYIGGLSIPYYGLVDSGSDYSVISKDIARLIGFEWDETKERPDRQRAARDNPARRSPLLASSSWPMYTVTTVIIARARRADMTLVRVRRQGNSTVVTLAQDIVEQAKLSDGDLIEERVDSKGRIVLEAVTTQPRISAKMATAIKGAARDKRAVLNRLAEHDRK